MVEHGVMILEMMEELGSEVAYKLWIHSQLTIYELTVEFTHFRWGQYCHLNEVSHEYIETQCTTKMLRLLYYNSGNDTANFTAVDLINYKAIML